MKKSVMVALSLVFIINLVSAFPDFSALDLLGRPTETSITINLIAGENPTSGYIEYGTEQGVYTDSTPIQNVDPNELLEFELINLQSNTQYYYILKAKDTTMQDFAESDERSFRTKRESYSFNFTLITDSHINLVNSADRLIGIANKTVQNDNSDFVIFLGDNMELSENGYGYIEDEIEAIQKYEKFRDALISASFYLPSFFTIGNWEGEAGWIEEENLTLARNIRKKYIPNPSNTTYLEGGNDHEDYYAFTWGNALFVVLNVMSYTEENPQGTGDVEDWHLGTDQLNWLNDTLINSTEPWKFILIHHAVGGEWEDPGFWSFYGRGGGYAAYVGEQATVHQMMIDNDVQAFFHGHDHVFTDVVVEGVHYIEAGNSGYLLSFPEQYPYCFANHGRTKVEIISSEIAKVSYIDIYEETLIEIIIDRLPPEIELIQPQQSSISKSTTKRFKFIVSDSSNIEKCNLILDGELEQTIQDPEKDIILEFNVNNIAPGTHTWNIECKDNTFNDGVDYYAHDGNYTPNTQTSETRTFRILGIPKYLATAIMHQAQIR